MLLILALVILPPHQQPPSGAVSQCCSSVQHTHARDSACVAVTQARALVAASTSCSPARDSSRRYRASRVCVLSDQPACLTAYLCATCKATHTGETVVCDWVRLVGGGRCSYGGRKRAVSVDDNDDVKGKRTRRGLRVGRRNAGDGEEEEMKRRRRRQAVAGMPCAVLSHGMALCLRHTPKASSANMVGMHAQRRARVQPVAPPTRRAAGPLVRVPGLTAQNTFFSCVLWVRDVAWAEGVWRVCGGVGRANVSASRATVSRNDLRATQAVRGRVDLGVSLEPPSARRDVQDKEKNSLCERLEGAAHARCDSSELNAWRWKKGLGWERGSGGCAQGVRYVVGARVSLVTLQR